MRSISLATLAITGLMISSAMAEEPRGCDKFKWPIENERALLTSPDAVKISTAAEMATPPAGAMVLALAPFAEARLPMAPEHAPKAAESFAGFVRVAGISRPGNYLITLSSEAWIDAIEDGHYLKPQAFSGALDCSGIRKSVRFVLSGHPLTLQLSGVPAAAISVVITPAE